MYPTELVRVASNRKYGFYYAVIDNVDGSEDFGNWITVNHATDSFEVGGKGFVALDDVIPEPSKANWLVALQDDVDVLMTGFPSLGLIRSTFNG